MGHRKKSMNTSSDITRKEMIRHAEARLCFVSHYTNGFVLFQWMQILFPPSRLKNHLYLCTHKGKLFLSSVTVKSEVCLHITDDQTFSKLHRKWMHWPRWDVERGRYNLFTYSDWPEGVPQILWGYDTASQALSNGNQISTSKDD